MTVSSVTDAARQWFPVSFAQQRVWFLDRLSPGSAAYIIPVTVRLTAAVDVAALTRTLDEIVRRHEVLRTTFAVRRGELEQTIEQAGVVGLPVVDLQDVPAEGRQIEVGRRVAVEARRPFDLAAGPLIRATLFRLGSHDHLLFVAIHHIVADGWSVGVFVKELRAIYPAVVRGLPSPLPELGIQYVDYATWQRQHLRGAVLEEELRYWRHELAGLPPLSMPRTASAAVGSSTRSSMRVPAELTARLAALSRGQGTTMFMTLLGGFQALLHRVSGQDDFAVGTVIANRTRAETEDLIGCFVNTLVIRCIVSPRDTFADLLRRAREATLSAYTHQELPFERLVAELRPAREPGRNPLVQVLFSFHNTPPVSRQSIDRDSGTSGDLDRGTANFDLTVDIWATHEGLQGRWEFRPDLFTGPDVERLIGQYIRLLEALTEQPGLLVAQAPLIDQRERLALVERARGRPTHYPDEPVHRTIADRALRWPARIAASSETETLTYAELAARSERLAGAVRRCSVTGGEVVGICLRRSPSWGVAVLGVLAAGGAFLPMDPGDPPARRVELLKNAGVRIVVTDSTLAARLTVGGVDLIRIDDLDVPAESSAGGSGAGESNPGGSGAGGSGDDRDPAPEFLEPLAAAPVDQLAYLVYTSGSTGAPKGALIPHRALANHCHAVAERYGLDPTARALQLAPVGFDVAIEEVLPVWLTGGSVYFPAQDGPLSPADLGRYVDRRQITVLNLPASYWHEWVDHLQRTGGRVPGSLRLVVCGSERVSTEKLRRWQDLAGPQARWMNAYGVSEATITATTYEPPRPVPPEFPDVVPIGRPLPNVNAYVLDGARQPVPDGATGELYLGGAGVALGYLGRPELTAVQFVSPSTGKAADPRLYRTGDLVRRDVDGELHFLGRRDDQVKVRGHRVELGEIEAALMRHPGVREAVVTVRTPGTVGDQLIAHIVPGAGPAPDALALTAHLRALLPAHMMPNAFVDLPSLPRSAHGKIDRAALVTPAQARPQAVGPRTDLEQQLADLWSAVLGVPEVGVDDNFFDLGGHSLLAMRLVSRAHTALQIEIPLRMVFDAPTVAGLAAAIDRDPAGGAAGGTHPIVPHPAPGPGLPVAVEEMSDAEVDAMLAELLEEDPP